MQILTIFIAASETFMIFRFFRRLGAIGLFLVGALDSSFLVLPFGNDALLMALVNANRTGPVWIFYVLVSVAGSLVGVFLLDLVMRKAGEKGLRRFVSPERIEQLKERFANKFGVTVFIATLLPPPFPLTPVLMAASALQCERAKLFGAVAAGRLVRFTGEALLALYFGRKVFALMRSETLLYIVYGMIAIAAIASTISIIKWVSSGKLKPQDLRSQI